MTFFDSSIIFVSKKYSSTGIYFIFVPKNRDKMKEEIVVVKSSPEFRTTVRLEDIVDVDKYPSYEVVGEGGVLESVVDLTGYHLPYPNMSYLYFRYLDGIEDPLLKSAVYDLMSINPGINTAGMQNMMQYIHRQMVRYNEKTREYQIPFELFSGKCLKYVKYYQMGDEHKFLGNKVLVFQKNSTIPFEERREMALQVRRLEMASIKQLYISKAVNFLIQAEPMIKITYPRVHKKAMGEAPKMKSINSLKRNISEESIEVMKEEDLKRFFSTEKEKSKFEEFLKLISEGKSSNQAAKSVGVSPNTASFFNKVITQIKRK